MISCFSVKPSMTWSLCRMRCSSICEPADNIIPILNKESIQIDKKPIIQYIVDPIPSLSLFIHIYEEQHTHTHTSKHHSSHIPNLLNTDDRLRILMHGTMSLKCLLRTTHSTDHSSECVSSFCFIRLCPIQYRLLNSALKT